MMWSFRGGSTRQYYSRCWYVQASQYSVVYRPRLTPLSNNSYAFLCLVLLYIDITFIILS